MILLNHQHLYYFWVSAKLGSVTKASRKLFLSQSTISNQIIQLEKFLGKKLFDREKRQLSLTREGRIVLDYADRIFSTTQELLQGLKHPSMQNGVPYNLGIDTQVSKQMVVKLIEAIYQHKPGTHVIVREGSMKDLLEQLNAHVLDFILSDHVAPVGQGDEILSVEVGRLDIFFVASPLLAAKVKSFPADLGRLPLLLPTAENPIRSSVQRYLVEKRVAARITAEVEDAGLLRQMALQGLGAAPVHEISVASDLRDGRLKRIGRAPLGITKTYWLIAKNRQQANSLTKFLLKNFRIAQ